MTSEGAINEYPRGTCSSNIDNILDGEDIQEYNFFKKQIIIRAITQYPQNTAPYA